MLTRTNPFSSPLHLLRLLLLLHQLQDPLLESLESLHLVRVVQGRANPAPAALRQQQGQNRRPGHSREGHPVLPIQGNATTPERLGRLGEGAPVLGPGAAQTP